MRVAGEDQGCGRGRISGGVGLCHALPVDLKAGDGDRLPPGKVGAVVLLTDCGVVARPIDERRACGGEIGAQVEEQGEMGPHSRLEAIVQGGCGIDALAGGIADG